MVLEGTSFSGFNPLIRNPECLVLWRNVERQPNQTCGSDRCPFDRLVWLAIDGFPGFRLVLLHLPVPSIFQRATYEGSPVQDKPVAEHSEATTATTFATCVLLSIG